MKTTLRHWLIAFGAVLLCSVEMGCSGGLQDGDPEPPDEVGSISQAIYVAGKYGMDSANQRRCYWPNVVGDCVVPNNKSWSYSINFADHPNWNSTLRTTPCSQWWRNNIIHAMETMALEANSRGWNVMYVGDFPSTGVSSNYQINCDSSGTLMGSDSAGAETRVSTWPGDYECHNVAGQSADLCQYSSASMHLYAGWLLNSPTSQISSHFTKVVRNIVRHEAGHRLGLGHPLQIATSPLMAGTVLSSTDAFQAPWTTTDLFPTYTEWQWVDCYNPNSGTGDHCGPNW